MKTGLTFFLLLAPFTLFAQASSTAPATRSIAFDAGWLFANDNPASAELANFADASWRKVDLPHDWSIEDLPNQTPGRRVGPFDKDSPGGTYTGFTPGGTGWYRKHFVTTKATQNKRVTIQFDGVYMNSEVWLNGHRLGIHPYGYTPFFYELTPYLKPVGQENVVAVKVRNEGKNSRWYSGSGIYRHVWLTVTEPVHVAPWGVFVTTPKVSAASATVQVATTVANQQPTGSTVTVVTTVLSPSGSVVGRRSQTLAVAAQRSAATVANLPVAKPALWSGETPRLYQVVTEIKAGATVLDRVETSFGVRSLSFSAQSGLLLNGKRVLLKGGCIHHDNGPLGAAAIDRAEERKIEILKQNGFNAVRLSHNPPSQQLLDACDRLGMLVVDEAFDMWTQPKRPDDYHLYFKEWWQRDLDAMLLRDHNHPSIILWSIGNEIPERVDSVGLATRRMLKQRVRQLDPTRQVTEAIHRTPRWEERTPAAFADLDVAGYNYMKEHYEADHAKFPNRVMMGTETYPLETLENWSLAEQNPYVLGDFVWTAMDYLGEASIGNATLDSAKAFHPSLGWPWFNAYSGDIDLVGDKKSASYYRDVVWRTKPLAMAVHAPIPSGKVENVSRWGWPDERQSWNWAGSEGQPLQVRVFSRAPLVRLLLNGNVIGEQKIAPGSITAEFKVPYQPGTLRAANVENGVETAAVEFKTAGKPARLRLVADRASIQASRNDLSYVRVEVTDDLGQVVPTAELPIHFTISGAGEIAGVGNASPTDMASFQRPERKTVGGKCLAIVRPRGQRGTITLTATASGLPPAQVVITTH